MVALQLVWSYVKKYWWIAAAIVGFILFKRWTDQSGDLAQALNDIQKAHEDELAKIQAANDARQKASEEDLKKMQDRLDAIEKQYVEAQQELDDQKRAQIQSILQQDAGDSDALAKRLSDATGFKVILPS